MLSESECFKLHIDGYRVDALTAWEIRGENCRAQQVKTASPDHQGGTAPQLHGSRLFGRAVCREYASGIMLSHVCL